MPVLAVAVLLRVDASQRELGPDLGVDDGEAGEDGVLDAAFLPNIDGDDVLVAGTLGRGVWTLGSVSESAVFRGNTGDLIPVDFGFVQQFNQRGVGFRRSFVLEVVTR